MELFSVTFFSDGTSPKLRNQLYLQLIGSEGSTANEINVRSSLGRQLSSGPVVIEGTKSFDLIEGPHTPFIWLHFREASAVVFSHPIEPPPLACAFPGQSVPTLSSQPRSCPGPRPLWLIEFNVARPSEVSEHCFYTLPDGTECSFPVPAKRGILSFAVASGNAGYLGPIADEWAMWRQLHTELRTHRHILLLAGDFIDHSVLSRALDNPLLSDDPATSTELLLHLYLLTASQPQVAAVLSRCPTLFAPFRGEVGRLARHPHFEVASRRAFLAITTLTLPEPARLPDPASSTDSPHISPGTSPDSDDERRSAADLSDFESSEESRPARARVISVPSPSKGRGPRLSIIREEEEAIDSGDGSGESMDRVSVYHDVMPAPDSELEEAGKTPSTRTGATATTAARLALPREPTRDRTSFEHDLMPVGSPDPVPSGPLAPVLIEDYARPTSPLRIRPPSAVAAAPLRSPSPELSVSDLELIISNLEELENQLLRLPPVGGNQDGDTDGDASRPPQSNLAELEQQFLSLSTPNPSRPVSTNLDTAFRPSSGRSAELSSSGPSSSPSPDPTAAPSGRPSLPLSPSFVLATSPQLSPPERSFLHSVYSIDRSAFILLDLTLSTSSALISGPSFAWLKQTLESLVDPSYIFVVSPLPVAFAERRRVRGQAQSWDDFSGEQKEQLLALFTEAAERYSAEVVFLSGAIRVALAAPLPSPRLFQFVSSAIRCPASARIKASAGSPLLVRRRNFLLCTVREQTLSAEWVCERRAKESAARRHTAELQHSTAVLPSAPVPADLEDARMFVRTLRYPQRQHAFKRFLESVGRPWALPFWEDVEGFKLTYSEEKEKQSAAAQTLYRTYLSTQATRPANVSAEVRDRAFDSTRAGQISPGLFDEAQNEVLAGLRQSFAAFLRSPFYVVLTEAQSDPPAIYQLAVGIKLARRAGERDDYKTALLQGTQQALELAQHAPAAVRASALYHCARWLTQLTGDFQIPFHSQAFAYFEEAAQLSVASLHLLYADWGAALSQLIDLAPVFSLSPAQQRAYHDAAQAKFTAALALRPHHRIHARRAADFARCSRLYPASTLSLRLRWLLVLPFLYSENLLPALHNPFASPWRSSQDAPHYLLRAHESYAQALMLKPTSRRCLRAWGNVIEAALENYNGERPWGRSVAEAVEAYLNALVVYVLKREASPRPGTEDDLMPELAPVHLMALSEHKWVAEKAVEALTRLSKCTLATQVTDLLAGIDTARRARKLQQTESERLWTLENLPAELKADLKAAAISQTEILTHWEPFLACLRCYARQLVEISALMPFPIEPRPHSRHLSVDPATELRKILRPYPAERDYSNFILVGRGGFGDVFKAVGKDGVPVAVKALKKAASQNVKQIYTEVNFMRTSAHPSIVAFKSAYIYRERVSIVMEYCDASDLRFFYENAKLEEDEIAYFIHNVTSALAYLHSQNRVHRDIKAENVLLNMSGEVKLADLGISAQLQAGERLTQVAGSKYWIAPEMFTGTPYNTKVDIWSLGALLYELCHREAPYEKAHPLRALLSTALSGAPPFNRGWSQELLAFADCCFQRDSEQRLPADQLLRHLFLEPVPYQTGRIADSLKEKLQLLFMSKTLETGFL